MGGGAAGPLPQDHARQGGGGALLRGDLPERSPAGAGANRAGSRRHRRSSARRAGGSFLSWLLRRLLLSAAVHLQQLAPTVRALTQLQLRCIGGGGGRGAGPPWAGSPRRGRGVGLWGGGLGVW